MMDETQATPKSVGIQPGISLVKHMPGEIGLCSIRTFTFDQYGRPTVTVLDLEREQALRLRDALDDALDGGSA